KLGLSICYDLRFPELYRRQVRAGAELLLVPSAFTFTTGSAHWEVLCRARAIENQCYLMAANQSGTSPHGFADFGGSMIVGPWGAARRPRRSRRYRGVGEDGPRPPASHVRAPAEPRPAPPRLTSLACRIGARKANVAMWVSELWRYPVKSMAGEPMHSVLLGPDGIDGDRLLHVRDGRGRVVTARSRRVL